MSSDKPAESQNSPSPSKASLPAPVGKTWNQAAGLPETVAPLEELPSGIQFGEDFPEPICYDSRRKVLIYRGQMFHSNFTFLSSMSRDARFYHALEQLFVNSAKATQPKRRWLWLW